MNVRVFDRVTSGFIVWLVLRAAAIALLVLVPLKVWSGWAFMRGGPAWLARLHVDPWLDVLLIAAVAFHGLFGLRTLLIEIGLVGVARGLAVAATVVAAALTLLAIALNVG